MGGSFNPPHAAHMTVARTAIKRLGLVRLWMLVTPGNPLKDNADLPRLAARRHLVEALADHKQIIASGLESELAAPFTATTVAFLATRHRSARFVWVMGADAFASFHRWYRWQEIAELVPIAVADRPGWRLRSLASPAARQLARYRIGEESARLLPMREPPCWTFLSMRLSKLSSTELRQETLGDR